MRPQQTPAAQGETFDVRGNLRQTRRHLLGSLRLERRSCKFEMLGSSPLLVLYDEVAWLTVKICWNQFYGSP